MKANEFNTLLLRFIDGDESSFNQIYNVYYHKLVGAAFLILHEKEAAQNIASDIFVKILCRPSEFLNIRNPSAYLFTAAQNCARNALRHDCHMVKSFPKTEVDYSNAIISRLDFYRLLEMRFDKDDQEMLILRCVWDCTYAEIAKRLNIPLGTVKTRFRRFKRQLKDIL